MAKKRKAKSKVRKSKKVDARALKRARDEKEKLNLPHGVITGAYATTVEQMHPDGYDEQRLAKRGKKRKTKRKVKAKAAPKRKTKVRRKK